MIITYYLLQLLLLCVIYGLCTSNKCLRHDIMHNNNITYLYTRLSITASDFYHIINIKYSYLQCVLLQRMLCIYFASTQEHRVVKCES